MKNLMTNQEYRIAEGLSNSFLVQFDRSPAHAFMSGEPTTAQEFGTMVHTFVLEPELFDGKYLTVDKIDKRTKEYKELVDKNPGMIIISRDDYDKLVAMRESIYKLTIDGKSLKSLLNKAENELSIFWTDEITGLKKKARIDSMHIPYAFDIKTTENAGDFSWSIKNFKYYRQASWYLDAIKSVQPLQDIRFIFIAVEKSEPFGAKLYELSEDYIQAGRIANENTVLKYQDWLIRGADQFECYGSKIEVVEKPTWL